jgi:hypothetical protein
MASEPIPAVANSTRTRTLDASLSRGAAAQDYVATPDTRLTTGGKRRLSVRTFDSLSDRSFRWYFFSMFGWFASMNMQMLVRGVIVYNLTGSYAALGLISLANAIPGLFLS